MEKKLVPTVIVLLAVMNVLTFVYTSQAKGDIVELTRTVQENTNKVVYVQAEDGYTPIKNVDYFDGVNGTNAVSYAFNTTVIKEIPLMGQVGPKGDDGLTPECYFEEAQCRGVDAPVQQMRVNPSTGDIETKLSDRFFWNVIVPCADYKNECPEVANAD